MKDLIISAISNYTPDKIKEYVNSINKCGFTGDKIMICYPIPQNTIDFLKENGWELYSMELKGHPHMKRLIDMYAILREVGDKYRYVISTDVRDVVFQTNPSEWLEKNLKKQFIVSSENVLYKDEQWGTKNILEGYGQLLLDRFKNNQSCNVGVLAGYSKSIKDLLLINYLISQAGDTQHFTDQSSYNFLVHSEFMKDSIQIEDNTGTWAIQLGTHDNPNILNNYDIETTNHNVTNNGEPFCIVHQYDRVQSINTIIRNKYK